MSLRAYLTAMGLATVVAAATFFLVLFRVDPTATGVLGFALFYASLFLTITGALSLIGFTARVFMRRGEVLSRLVGAAFRQAVLFAALAVGALFLHSQHLLSWWNSLILVALVTLAEFLFLSSERRPITS